MDNEYDDVEEKFNIYFLLLKLMILKQKDYQKFLSIKRKLKK